MLLSVITGTAALAVVRKLPVPDADAAVSDYAHKTAASAATPGRRPTFNGPPGECGAAPGVATRDSGYSGSRLACSCERRCDARVRSQQRGCGVPSFALCKVQRSLATLQQCGVVWGRQAGRAPEPPLRIPYTCLC